MGNLIQKNYNVEEQIGVGGPSQAWKIYNAKRRDNGEAVSLFVFEKRDIYKTHGKNKTEAFCSILKKEFTIASKLRHPNILRIRSPLTDTKDVIVAECEPLMTSLFTLLESEKKKLKVISSKIRR